MKFKQITTLEYELHLTESEALDAMNVAIKAKCDVATLLTSLTASGLHHAKTESNEIDDYMPELETDDDGNSITPSEWPED